MSIETRRLTPQFGLEILGLDLSSSISEADRKAVMSAWIQGGIVLVRGCASAEAHLRLSECFGKLEPSATKILNNAISPFLMDLRYDPASQRAPGTLMRVNGQDRAGWLGWHWDQSFMPVIVRGAALRMIEPASTAGETGFIDAIDAYARLPQRLKQAVEGREVIYHFTGAMEKNRFGFPADLQNLRSDEEMREQETQYVFEPVVHPLVITQKETGRKVLKLSPMHAQRIAGMSPDASDDLLRELADHLVNPAYAYFHKWSANEVIVWDNWRVIHSAAGVPLDVPRYAQRTTLLGDYGFGRYLDATRERTDIGATLVD